MDNNILKILNEELLESKRRTKLAEQRLDLHSKEFKETQKILGEHKEALDQHKDILNQHKDILNQHKDILNQHKAGFEIMFRNMGKMEKRLNVELKRLKKD